MKEYAKPKIKFGELLTLIDFEDYMDIIVWKEHRERLEWTIGEFKQGLIEGYTESEVDQLMESYVDYINTNDDWEIVVWLEECNE